MGDEERGGRKDIPRHHGDIPRTHGRQTGPIGGPEAGVDDRELEQFARRLARALQGEETLDDGFADRLEARLRAEAAQAPGSGPEMTGTPATPATPGTPALRILAGDGAARAPRGWLRRGRRVTVSPLTGLLAAAAFGGAVALGAWWGGRGLPAPPAAIAAADAPGAVAPTVAARVDTVRLVQFVLVAPAARQVALVGDFNDWQAAATPMQAGASGIWTVQVPLAPGRHQYAFVVDGREWIADPSAPRAVEDDFDTPSSVITIGERRT